MSKLFKMRNKKGDIAITILVIGTLAVCMIALISFKLAGEKRDEEISIFKYLEVLNNVKDDLTYSGQDLSFVKEELYFSSYSQAFGAEGYNPIVSQIMVEGDYLKITKIKKRGLLWRKTEKFLFEIKVKK